MRQLLVGALQDEKNLEWIKRPYGEGWTLDVPEPNSSNIGKTGFFGFGCRPLSDQKLTVTVERSGDYVDYWERGGLRGGARFIFEPEYLKDSDGNDAVDEVNRLGGERGDIAWVAASLVNIGLGMPANSGYQIGSIKAKKLTKWDYQSDQVGYQAIAVAASRKISDNSLKFHVWRMSSGVNHYITSAIWGAGSNVTTGYLSSTEPSCDVVELEDGSLVLAVTNYAELEITIYKSFDGGSTWEETAAGPTISGIKHYVALERIGNRVVLIYSMCDGSDVYVNYIYSDDNCLSWSNAGSISTDTGATGGELDSFVGKNGKIYIAWRVATGIKISSSIDGGTWDSSTTVSGVTADGGVSICQEYNGLWRLFVCYQSANGIAVRHYKANSYSEPGSTWSGGEYVEPEANDSDGMDAEHVCARPLMDDGFTEVLALYHDDHLSDYWNIVSYRNSMWSGVQFDNGENWDGVWSCNGYPSTSDSHPNLNYWSKLTAGSNYFNSLGSSTTIGSNYMNIWSTDNLSGLVYAFYPGVSSYDDGLTAFFELKVISGYAKVYVRTTSSSSNTDLQFTIYFDAANNKIVLYDEIASSIVAQFTPTNWSVTTWNSYLLLILYNQVFLYRAPTEVYREVLHLETVFNRETPSTDVYPGSVYDRILWGIYTSYYGGVGASSSTRWKSFFVAGKTITSLPYSFSNLVGKGCHPDGCGLLQGFGCKFDGDFAVEADEWTMRTISQFDGENILQASPRIRWAEPSHSDTSSSDKTFTFRVKDDDDNEKNVPVNAVAVFGLNYYSFNLYGENWDGSSSTLLLDSNTLIPYATAHDAYKVQSVDNNVVKLTPTTPGDYDTDLIPGQFASDSSRQFYCLAIITSGSKYYVYKILDNTEDTLFLDGDAETDGLAADDLIYPFADRGYFMLSQTYTYPRYRFVLECNGRRPPPTDQQFKIGTLVLGMSYGIDDEWGSEIVHAPNVSLLESKSGLRQWSEMGPARRMVRLSYSGRTDRGMAVEGLREVLRVAKWGQRPVVWIDDDYRLLPGSRSHIDPILAKVRGPVTHAQKAYQYKTENTNEYVRTIYDVSGVVLEEVL